jgi:predicted transcriptional regulator
MKIEITQKEVLSTVEKLSPATVSDIAKSLNTNQMFVSGYLSALEELNLVKSKNVGSSVVYMVNGK